jgi:hypothetical protein
VLGAFHAGNRGSNPLGDVIIVNGRQLNLAAFFIAGVSGELVLSEAEGNPLGDTNFQLYD